MGNAYCQPPVGRKTFPLVIFLSTSLQSTLGLINLDTSIAASGLDPLQLSGRTSNIRRHPYFVSLRDPETGFHYCGGFLIDPATVLTAANCVDSNTRARLPSAFLVRAWCREELSACSEDIFVEISAPIESLTVEPAWMGDVLGDGDLALLVLERAIWGPVLAALPQPPRTALEDTTSLIFVGYQALELSSRASMIQILEPQYLDANSCSQAIEGTTNTRLLGGDKICARGMQSTECEGFSGGPLIVNIGETDNWQDDRAVGVLSAGPGCGLDAALPALFTHLLRYELQLRVLGFPDASIPQLAGPAGPRNLEGTPAPTTAPTAAPTPAPTLPPPLSEADLLMAFKAQQPRGMLPGWSVRRPMCEWSGVTCGWTSEVVMLSLRANRLAGTLPPEWSKLTSITMISLGQNSLRGTLPPQWSALTDLAFLWLDGNALSGLLPVQWSALASASDIRLNQNRLVGTLPLQWSALSKARTMNIHNNTLAGMLPPQWSALVYLNRMDLHGNSFGGTLPPQWSNLRSIEWMLVFCA